MPSLKTLQAFAATVESNDHVGAIRNFYSADARTQENDGRCFCKTARRPIIAYRTTAVAERGNRNPPSPPLWELELVAPLAPNRVSGDSPVWVEAIDGSNRVGDCCGAGNRSSKPSSALDPRLIIDWPRRRLNSQ